MTFASASAGTGWPHKDFTRLRQIPGITPPKTIVSAHRILNQRRLRVIPCVPRLPNLFQIRIRLRRARTRQNSRIRNILPQIFGHRTMQTRRSLAISGQHHRLCPVPVLSRSDRRNRLRKPIGIIHGVFQKSAGHFFLAAHTNDPRHLAPRRSQPGRQNPQQDGNNGNNGEQFK